MKKAKKLFYHLRIAAETAALLLITTGLFMFIANQNAINDLMSRFWPFLAVIIAMYCGLTIGEEYLNERMLKPRL